MFPMLSALFHIIHTFIMIMIFIKKKYFISNKIVETVENVNKPNKNQCWYCV